MSPEPLGLHAHHIGFVVADIDAGMKGFVRSLAAVWDGVVYEDPIQKVRVAFLAAGGGGMLIELVEPAAKDSPVSHFLADRGGGLHHICYEVKDLEREMAMLKSRGALIVRRPRPAVAFQGRQIAWLLTRERLLIELLEQSLGGG